MERECEGPFCWAADPAFWAGIVGAFLSVGGAMIFVACVFILLDAEIWRGVRRDGWPAAGFVAAVVLVCCFAIVAAFGGALMFATRAI